jgi:hypothetical protein
VRRAGASAIGATAVSALVLGVLALGKPVAAAGKLDSPQEGSTASEALRNRCRTCSPPLLDETSTVKQVNKRDLISFFTSIPSFSVGRAG